MIGVSLVSVLYIIVERSAFFAEKNVKWKSTHLIILLLHQLSYKTV